MSTPWAAVELPTDPALPPTMLWEDELRYLIWLGASAQGDLGAVVDLGPWLGGSTCALAEGLRRARRTQTVHAFDRFLWRRHYMENRHPSGLADHADFQSLFATHVEPWADQIDARAADLRALSWDGGPIGILMVDAAKDWELASAILATFGTALVPGRSLVVLQDYQHWSTPFLPLIFGGRPDLWEPVHCLTEGTTASFCPRKPVIGSGGVDLPYGPSSFPWEETERIMQRLVADHPGPVRARLRAGYLRLATMAQRTAEADALRQELVADPHAEPLISRLDAIEDTLYSDLQRAATLREAGERDAALVLARACHAHAPEEVYVNVELIACLHAAGCEAEAWREADALIHDAPGFAAGWLARAQLHAAVARPDDAIEDARTALVLDPLATDAREIVTRLGAAED